ncbi:MAG TPA: bacillithiol biosynthesis BshC, partial [Gemmatimonadales bacterium]
RPVVERAILPTVAYLAGPGELAYFAQVSAVAEALGAAAPLALPRRSVTIVEDHMAKLVRRLDTSEDELRDPHAAAGRLARIAMPATVGRALATLRETVTSELGRVAEDPEAGKLLPVPALEGAARAIGHRLDRLERRFVAAVKREEALLMTDLATARGYFFPHDGRQERVLNFLPVLARQGRPLLEAMVAEATRHAREIVQ